MKEDPQVRETAAVTASGVQKAAAARPVVHVPRRAPAPALVRPPVPSAPDAVQGDTGLADPGDAGVPVPEADETDG